MRAQDLGAGVLVALHGHGDEASSALEWGRSIAPPGWEVIAPPAPRGADGVSSWFANGPRGAAESDLGDSVARVIDVAAEVRVAGRRVVVAGFSQGAAVALEVAARGGRVDGVVAICAFLAEPDAPSPRRTFIADVPVLVLAGERDDVVPGFMATDAAATLSAQGLDVELHHLDMAHEVAASASDAVQSWIAGRFGVRPRVSLGLPVERVGSGAELLSGSSLAQLAQGYEALGYDAAYVTDHPAPDDRWLAGGGHHAMEPTVALAVAASATRRLILHTNVYVLGYRNPFLAAKALSSLDVVSGGRLVVGVAAGYLRPEFAALGADFDERGRRLDEALELLPRIWSEEGVAATGPGYSARAVTALPRPHQRPHPPIWVGGNSLAAMRRAVRFGQGWSPFPAPDGVASAVRTASISNLADLADRMGRLEELVQEAGRAEPLTVCFVPFSLPRYLADPASGLASLCEEVAELHELGVDWVALMVPGTTRREVLDHAAALAAQLGLG